MIEKLLERVDALPKFKFGHTQTQIEYFQTASQSGDRRFEYWQHLLQLKSLRQSIMEIQVSLDETSFEMDDASSWWPVWNRARRRRCLPRLKLKRDTLAGSLQEKTGEMERHLEIIDRKYSDLTQWTEDQILDGESDYWSKRLGRQLGASRLGTLLGISESEILAVMALPEENRQRVFGEMQEILASSRLLPEKGTT